VISSMTMLNSRSAVAGLKSSSSAAAAVALLVRKIASKTRIKFRSKLAFFGPIPAKFADLRAIATPSYLFQFRKKFARRARGLGLQLMARTGDGQRRIESVMPKQGRRFRPRRDMPVYRLTAVRSISTLQPGTSSPLTWTVVRGGGEGKNSRQT
jgi:hypothetical protein